MDFHRERRVGQLVVCGWPTAVYGWPVVVFRWPQLVESADGHKSSTDGVAVVYGLPRGSRHPVSSS